MEENPAPVSQPANIPTDPESVGEQPMTPDAPSKSRLPMVLVGLLIFGLLIAISYLYYQNTQLKRELVMRSLEPPTISVNATCEYKGNIYKVGESFMDDCNSCSCDSNGQVACTMMGCLDDDLTAGWEIYINDQLGFSFQYPPTYKITREERGNNELYISLGGEGDVFELTVSLDSEYGSLASRLDPIGTITENNLTWMIYPESEYCDAGMCGKTPKVYETKSGEIRYTLVPPESNTASEYVNKIISTFQTTEGVKPCIVGGCNSEICAENKTISPCARTLHNTKLVCYQEAICERNSDGMCGWKQTESLLECFANNSDKPQYYP